MSQSPLFKSTRCCWVHERLRIVCDPPMPLCEWVEKARQVVKSVHSTVDFECATPQTEEAYRGFIFCLEEYFLVTDSFMDLEGVRDSWRHFYRSCLPL